MEVLTLEMFVSSVISDTTLEVRSSRAVAFLNKANTAPLHNTNVAIFRQWLEYDKATVKDGDILKAPFRLRLRQGSAPMLAK